MKTKISYHLGTRIEAFQRDGKTFYYHEEQNADQGRKTAKPKIIRDTKDKYREISRWDVGNNVIKRIRNHKKTHNTISSFETDKEKTMIRQQVQKKGTT